MLLSVSIGLTLALGGPTSSWSIQSYGMIRTIFPLHVSGNQILDANNNTVILKGIGKMGTEYAPTFDGREVDPQYWVQDFAMMKGWGANFIRLPLNLVAYNTSASYVSGIQQEINDCMADGFFVLLDVHWYSLAAGQFPDGAWTNNNSITDAVYNITNSQVYPWCQQWVFPTMGVMAQNYNSSYYSGVIGLEINEFWPDTNRTESWLEDKQIFQGLADYVHLTLNCPKYLIFWQPAFEDMFNATSMSYKVGTSDSQAIVYAPHFYISDNYRPWFGGYLANSTYNDGWNWTAYYDLGDYTTGKTMMYRYLDNYAIAVFTAHNVPVVFDEIGVADNDAKGLDDMLSYFDSHSFGYNYWAWYGTSASGPQMCLLYGDWLSIRNNAYWLIKHMSYEHFFQWQNIQPTLTETYNWSSGSVADQLSFPQYTSNYIFSDGFESGNFSAWTSTDSNAMVTSFAKYQGSYSAQRNQSSSNNSGGFTIYKTLGGSYATVYLSFDYQLSALPPSGRSEYIASIENASGVGYCTLVMSNQGQGAQWGLFDVGENPDGSRNIQQGGYADPSIQPDTWYSIELEVNASGAYLWRNGVFLCSTSNLHLPFTNVVLLNNGASPWTCYDYVDNVKVATGLVQPDIASYSVQFYALNVTANTRVTLSNGTTFAALPYWNSTTKLLTVPVDPAETSITISDPTLMPG